MFKTWDVQKLFKNVKKSFTAQLEANPDKDPGTKFTMLGWTIYGQQPVMESFREEFFLQTGQEEFERLCSLDVLGLEDARPQGETGTQRIYSAAEKDRRGYYETKLLWKEGHVPLPTNKKLSQA